MENLIMAKNTTNSVDTATVAEMVRTAYDAVQTDTTTTRFSLAGGVKGVLKGQSVSFNSEHVAELALSQEDAVKTSRPATADESDLVANGGKVSVNKTFGGESGAALSALARLIELAGGNVPSKPQKPQKPRNANPPAPGTASNASPTTNGATP
jgi:hypothetical protein